MCKKTLISKASKKLCGRLGEEGVLEPAPVGNVAM